MKAGSNVRFVSVFFTPNGKKIEKGTIATTTYVDQLGVIVNIDGESIWASHDCVVEDEGKTPAQKLKDLEEKIANIIVKTEELESSLSEMEKSVEQIKFDDNELLDHVREFLKKVTQ